MRLSEEQLAHMSARPWSPEVRAMATELRELRAFRDAMMEGTEADVDAALDAERARMAEVKP
jgi:hypothetical protein